MDTQKDVQLSPGITGFSASVNRSGLCLRRVASSSWYKSSERPNTEAFTTSSSCRYDDHVEDLEWRLISAVYTRTPRALLLSLVSSKQSCSCRHFHDHGSVTQCDASCNESHCTRLQNTIGLHNITRIGSCAPSRSQSALH